MAVAKNYYDALGVDRKATPKEIGAAFRKLARKYHPDVNQGDAAAEQRFKEVSEAHEVLSDAEKRRYYDAFGAEWASARAAGIDPTARPSGRSPFAGGSPFGGNAQYTTQDLSQEEIERIFGGAGGGFGGIFGDLFRGQQQAPGTGRRRAAPMDVEGTVRVTLREAFTGTSRRVEMPDGRRLEVKVPAGVAEGTLLRVPGLLARVEIEPDEVFTREGRDVRVRVEVPLAAALLGGEVEVPTLRGKRVKLTVKPETQNGTRLRLRGLGMPDPNGGEPGDLLAEVNVRLPVPFDDATRAWAEQVPNR